MDLKSAVIVLLFAALVLGMPVAGIAGPSLSGGEASAEQRMNAAEASIDSMEEANVRAAEEPSLDEEIRDEVVIDENA